MRLPAIRKIWQNSTPLIWMVFVALAIRLAVVPFVYDEWMSPYNIAHYEQGNVARSLLSGHGFGSPFLSNQPSAIMPPTYPLIVAAFFRILGIHTPAAMIAILSLNCVFSALSCIPVFLVARRSFGPRVALWAGWGWALSPYGIYFSAEWAWSTHLLLLCLCWLFYIAQDMGCSSRLSLWTYFGLLAGFASLTEPSILVIIPFLIALAAKQLACAGKRWILPGMVASLAMAAVISPWMIRNAVVFHRLIPMRDSLGMEMYLGNNGYSFHWRSGDHHPNHDPKELAEYNAGELAYMDHKAEQAAAYIQTHQGWYVWMSARRALYLWTGYWSFEPNYLAQEPLDAANIPVASALSLLGFIGVVAAWQRRKFEAIRYAGVLFLYPVMYYFVHPEAYRMRPLDPFLVILGSHAIHALRGIRLAPVLERHAELALTDIVVNAEACTSCQ
jgi:4-amino-4-deoxy-L-arabinose transferase-like glycosyltransferase